MKLSVVMSVYNGADRLVETMDSILAQTMTDFEVVTINDGSTDASGALLDDYAKRDPRVRVMHQENRGLTRALIAGCAAARGELIARHDAGDTSAATRFAIQTRMLQENSDVTFVSCATQYVGPESEPLWITRPVTSGKALSILSGDPARPLSEGPTHHGSVMFRRDAYERAGGYRDAFYYGQDFDLWYRLAEGGTFQASEEVLYTARITAGSISSAARASQEKLATLSAAAFHARRRGESDQPVLLEAAKVLPMPGVPSRRNRAAGLYFIGEALRRNGDPRARRYLREALAFWPLSPRVWIRLIQSLT